jgi:hypothetical protein
VRLSIFAHLSDALVDKLSEADAQAMLNATTLRLYANAPSERPMRYAQTPSWPPNGTGCAVAQYPEWVKVKACAADMEAAERELGGLRYHFFVRFRPDMEYVGTLPPPAEWLHLRTDLVLTVLAIQWRGPNAPGAVASGSPLTTPENRLGTELALASRTFVDDNGILFARSHPFASAYFGLADAYTSCIHMHDAARVSVCGSRGLHASPECSIMLAMRTHSTAAQPLWSGELPWTTRFAFTECEQRVSPADRGSTGCPEKPLRRRARNAYEVPPWSLLARPLTPSHFSCGREAHLRWPANCVMAPD